MAPSALAGTVAGMVTNQNTPRPRMAPTIASKNSLRSTNVSSGPAETEQTNPS